jgi:hypothetical protein
MIVRVRAAAFLLAVSAVTCIGLVLVGPPHDGAAFAQMMLVPFVIGCIGTALRDLVEPANERKNPWQQ